MQHINLDKGLQNNTVLTMQTDMYSNLWLGLDNGIDYVEINSSMTYLSTYHNLSAGYAAVIYNGNLYLGTNRGVFYHDWASLVDGNTEQKFTLLQGTQGQVWSLRVIDETLFCGHNSGVYTIENNRVTTLSDVQGGWTFLQPKNRDDIVICGTYTYLVRFERKNGKWQKGKPIPGFKESARFMVNAEPGSIWISHGYKGVYKLYFNHNYDSVTQVEFFDHRHGFPSNKDISVFEIGKRPVFTTSNGIYSFNPQTKMFVHDDYFNRRFLRSDINHLTEDNKGNIWYFTPESAGVFRLKEDGQYTEVEIPFRVLDGKFIKWFQFVFPYDEKNVFLGTQYGFVHYDPSFKKNYQKPLKAFVREVKILAGKDSTIFSGVPSPMSEFLEIPYKFNQLQFDYAANDFENPNKLQFFTQLIGFDENWVAMQGQTFRQFTNLRYGKYIFRIKAVNAYGVESGVDSFTFTIGKPWYLTIYALIVYLIVVLIGSYIAWKYLRYRVERSKRLFAEDQKRIFEEKEKQMRLEALLQEQELIRLRNEKLNAEKIQKDKELTTVTMQIIQNSKTLIGIKNDLRRIAKEMGTTPYVSQIESVIRKINKTIDTENQ